MNLSHHTNRGRRGFTLVELLVVIVIIGLLAALITVAAAKGLAYARRTGNRTDISQMEVAVEQFKQRYGLYPPSQVILFEKYQDYLTLINSNPPAATLQLANDSVAVLTKMFRIVGNSNLDNTYPWTYNNPSDPQTPQYFIDWNGNGQYDQLPVLLEGDQAWVFFLGGIPTPCDASPLPGGGSGIPPSVKGFSTNSKDPSGRFGGTDWNPPLFEFSSSRLVLYIPPSAPANPNPSRAVPLSGWGWANNQFAPTYFYSYLDRYGASDGLGRNLSGAPYAYFSAYKAANGYNRYFVPNTTQVYSDCSWLSVFPYAESTLLGAVPAARKYLKPNSFQLLSAGADGVFGPGSFPNYDISNNFTGFSLTWTPAATATYNPGSGPISMAYSQQGPLPQGYDDQANFTSGQLGVGSD